MKICLIHPSSNAITVYPPTGILYIGAVLEKAGHAVVCLEPRPGEDFYLDALRRFRPDLVGFSFMTTDHERTRQVHAEVKGMFPSAVYCAGGVHPTAVPEQTLQSFGFDFVVHGEGELTLPEAVGAIERGEDLESVKGLYLPSSEGARYTGPRELVADLDSLPFPAWHLTDFGRYLLPPGTIHGFYHEASTTMMASRGCPFGCIYCSSHLIFGRRVRRRSVGNVLAEIRELQSRFGVEAVYFTDDTFTMSPEWVTEFCDEIERQGIRLRWSCQARVNKIDEDLIIKMKRSGLIALDFGVETGSQKIMKSLRKGTRVEDAVAAFNLARRHGVSTRAFFMLGNPEEVAEDLERTLSVARELKANRTNFYFTTPFPGTELYKMAVENGWLGKDINFSELWNFLDTDYPIMEIHFKKDELFRIRRQMKNKFVFRNYLFGGFNYRMVLRTMLFMLLHPGRAFSGAARFLRRGQLARFIEFSVREYELEINRTYLKKRGIRPSA